MLFDLLIQNGTIIDGSGSAAIRADIGVLDGKIAFIGHLDKAFAEKKIDADGLYVSPGFIDLHSHSDFTLLLDGRAESFIRQGVTTEVIGNCGLSAAPLKQPSYLRRNVFCYSEPFQSTWSSLADYLYELERKELGINVVPLVGHSAIRSFVMGFEQRQASDQEIGQMTNLLSACLEEGAWGLSSGLEYFPGSSASEKEINSLCRIVRRYDGLYATHVRNRDEHYQQGFQEPFNTAEKTGVRLQVSHIVPKYGAPLDAASWTLGKLNSYSEHTDLACDVIPYEWGPTTMTAILPPELLKENVNDIVNILKDSSKRESIRNQEQFFWLLFRDQCWDLVKLYHSKKFPQLVGKNGFELAKAMDTTPFDALLDILAEEGEQMFGVLMMGKIKRASDLAEFINYNRCGVISDGLSLSPTGRLKSINWSPGCYGWVPRFFEQFVGGNNQLSIEEGVSKITGFAASRLGLSDRGLIKKGNWADIVVFDLSRLIDNTSLHKPAVFSDGIRYVLLNGELIVKNGHYFETMNGNVLRRDH
jgi:N-acyl-D-aspartate/D-glutamate deacylase